MQNLSKSKQASIMAMSAALYAIFFFLSYSVTLPNFTLLYLPIILLGVFPVWFGWSGLVGVMIGGFMGGAFVEGLGFLGVFEAVVALLIYLLYWVFIPSRASEDGKRKSLVALLGVYAVSLLAGTGYILWQYTVLPQLFTATQAVEILVPTFAINLPIVLISCPALLRTISPKLRSWGMYVGTFWEWRKGKP
jgi:hypothetical protein